MSYKPTKEELIELWFEKSQNWISYILYEDEAKETALLYYSHPDDMFSGYLPSFYVNHIHFYPQSLEDIKTLIKLFTPN